MKEEINENHRFHVTDNEEAKKNENMEKVIRRMNFYPTYHFHSREGKTEKEEKEKSSFI